MSSLAGDPPPGSGLLLVLDAPLEVNYSNYTWNAETLETGLDTHTHTHFDNGFAVNSSPRSKMVRERPGMARESVHLKG